MKNRPSHATRQARLAPLDHLKPGGRPEVEPGASERDMPPEDSRRGAGAESANPAEPVTPGAGNTEAAQGKATGSPAAVATRLHLEGSEQGPR